MSKNRADSNILYRPFGSFLGREVGCDVYINNGFRLLGIPAGVRFELFEREFQRLRLKARSDPDAIQGFRIALGYDEYFDEAEKPLEYISRLDTDPGFRLVNECFWPHLEKDCGEIMRRDRSIQSSGLIDALNSLSSADGMKGIKAKHALAIIYHNLAIARELDSGGDGAGGADKFWEKAISSWVELLSSDGFWAFLKERIETIDDPRLKTEDIAQIKTDLPLIIIGFNRAFAQMYALSDEIERSAYHVRLIKNLDILHHAKDSTLCSLVVSLSNEMLIPLVKEAEQALLNLPEKVDYREFSDRCTPIFEKAVNLVNLFSKKLGLPDDVVKLARFDELSLVFLKAADSSIEYKGDNWGRNLFCSLLWTNKMARFPLSGVMRQKVQDAVRRDIQVLYRDILSPDSDLDPTRCWFLAGEDADPSSSIELSMYKITSIKRHRKLSVIVPRSKKAKLIHDGELTPEELLIPQQSYWKRPDKREYCPSLTINNNKIKNFIELLETYIESPDEVMTSINNGSLADWLYSANQSLLARELMNAANSTDSDRRIFSGIFLSAARDEANWKMECARSDLQDRIDREEKRKTTEVEKLRKAIDVEVEKYIKSTEKEAKENEDYIRGVEKEFQRRILEKKKEVGVQKRELEKEYGHLIEKAKTQYKKVKKQRSGVRSFVFTYVPFVISALIIFALTYKYWRVNPVFDYGPDLVAAVCEVSGVLLAALFNYGLIQKAKSKVGNIRGQLKRRIDTLEEDYNREVEDIRAEMDDMAMGARDRLEAIDINVRRIKKDGEKAIAEIQKEYDNRISEIKRKIEQKNKAMEQRIKDAEEALKREVSIRPESDKYMFPPYRTAKAKGFKDGREPGSKEIQDLFDREIRQLMGSLEPLDRIILARILDVASQEQAVQLLMELIETPVHERGKRIRSIIG